MEIIFKSTNSKTAPIIFKGDDYFSSISNYFDERTRRGDIAECLISDCFELYLDKENIEMPEDNQEESDNIYNSFLKSYKRLEYMYDVLYIYAQDNNYYLEINK